MTEANLLNGGIRPDAFSRFASSRSSPNTSA